DEPGAAALRILLVEHAVRKPHASVRVLAGRAAPPDATIAVGPEGGWTAAEVDAAAAAGFELLALGARTLRADAAPAAALAVLQHVWGDL
ncbi:MAG: RsmE family RNA methyltransferase, partial [Acidobacteria bacterium]|nr:RsmE family RNA methyltransferase [Acidobacteriota bacterium]